MVGSVQSPIPSYATHSLPTLFRTEALPCHHSWKTFEALGADACVTFPTTLLI